MADPTLEAPPPTQAPAQPKKVRTGRFGELEEHELVHLLDELDDERARSRFRESIYISVFVYLAIAWFLFYGQHFLFHTPTLQDPIALMREHDRLTVLNMPRTLRAPAPRPERAMPDRQTLKQLQREEPKIAAPSQPTPAPPTPAQPAPPPPPPVAVNQPPLPMPKPAVQPLVDAPSATPNVANNSHNPTDDLRRMGRNAIPDHGEGGGSFAEGTAPGGAGVGEGVDILSDTQGVDFNPYLKKIIREIYETWIPLLPDEARPPLNKQGVTQLRITIMPDGSLHVQDGANNGLVLEGSTHDEALNRAAWGSITGVGQFPPLPKEFHGPNLILSIHYLVNKQPGDRGEGR